MPRPARKVDYYDDAPAPRPRYKADRTALRDAARLQDNQAFRNAATVTTDRYRAPLPGPKPVPEPLPAIRAAAGKVPKLPRLPIGPLAVGIGLADGVYNVMTRPGKDLMNGFDVSGHTKTYGDYWFPTHYARPELGPVYIASYCQPFLAPLGGQFTTPKNAAEAAAITSWAGDFSFWARERAGDDRAHVISGYAAKPGAKPAQRVNNTLGPSKAPAEWSPISPNPNFFRWVNPTPQPVQTPLVRSQPEPGQVPQSATVITARIGEVAPAPAPRSIPRTRSEPPGPKEKQRKSDARRGIAAVFAGLDLISESAEVVDAFYQALPKDVRDKWDRGERPGDQMGQYGIDGADWKLQALWHNYHKLDLEQAIKNVLVNELEDRLYGAAFGARDNLVRGKYLNGGRYGSRKRKRKRSV